MKRSGIKKGSDPFFIQIKLIDYLISDNSRRFLANEIGHALLVNLDEWKYEAEYRLITRSFDQDIPMSVGIIIYRHLNTIHYQLNQLYLVIKWIMK